MHSIISSNHAEELAFELSTKIGKNSSIFDEDIVVVQSQGMAKWAQLKIAEVSTISTGVSFPFPKGFIGKTLAQCGLLKGLETFDRDVIVWKIFNELPTIASKFDILKGYLFDDGLDSGSNTLKRFQLAQKVSELFDNYLLFRYDWIEKWDAGEIVSSISSEHQHWQMKIWNSLDLKAEKSFTGAIRTFIDSPQDYADSLSNLDRVSLFGVTSLPPLHIEFFKALGEITEVDLYQVSPCFDYWAEIKKGSTIPLAGEGYDSEHPLLASWGTLGRDFQYNLLDQDLEGSGDVQRLRSFKATSMLSQIQYGLLSLDKSPPTKIDNSIEIHNCHSPKREVEVLLDRIYDAMNNDGLKSEEILVMCTNLDDYVPFINAVFKERREGMPKVNFMIADRSSTQHSPVAEMMHDLFVFTQGRFTANEVLGILQHPIFDARYNFGQEGLETIRDLISRSGFRWGFDENHRKACGVPSFKENSWVDGMQRMLLGVCFDDHELRNGEVAEVIEEQTTVLLGRFITAVNTLWGFHQQCQQDHDPEGWNDILWTMYRHFFEGLRDHDEELANISKSIADLSEHWSMMEVTDSMSPKIVLNCLEKNLDSEVGSTGFLQGGVTFCKMLPMRSIPMKMICVLGLGGMQYPRQNRSLGFDLMSHETRRGDRSMRLDDRYIFLETVLAAQEKLHLSYVGQSISDGSVCPPSVLIVELMEFVNRAEGKLKLLEVKHPLQPFSPQYFDGTCPVQSYSLPNLQAARAMISKPQAFEFCNEPIVEAGPEEDPIVLDVTSFYRFFSNPSRAFLKNRLGVNVYDEDMMSIDDDEPFELGNGGDRYWIRQSMIDMSEDGTKDIVQTLKSKGLGSFRKRGLEELRNELKNVEPLMQLKSEHVSGDPQQLYVSLSFNINGKNILIEGELEYIYGNTQFICRPSGVKSKDKVIALIQHLLASCMNSEITTIVAGCDKGVTSEEVFLPGEAEIDLKILLELYLKGQTKPLTFFPETSLAMAKGEKAARAAWEPSDYGSSDSSDDSISTCFSSTFPLDQSDEISNEFTDNVKIFTELMKTWAKPKSKPKSKSKK